MAFVTIALATLWASYLNLWCTCMKCAGQHPSCMYTTGLDSYMYAIPAPRIWSTQRWTGLQTCKWRLPLQESVDYNAVWCTMNEISHDLFPCIIINSNLPMLKCTLWCWSQPGLKPKQTWSWETKIKTTSNWSQDLQHWYLWRNPPSLPANFCHWNLGHKLNTHLRTI